MIGVHDAITRPQQVHRRRATRLGLAPGVDRPPWRKRDRPGRSGPATANPGSRASSERQAFRACQAAISRHEPSLGRGDAEASGQSRAARSPGGQPPRRPCRRQRARGGPAAGRLPLGAIGHDRGCRDAPGARRGNGRLPLILPEIEPGRLDQRPRLAHGGLGAAQGAARLVGVRDLPRPGRQSGLRRRDRSRPERAAGGRTASSARVVFGQRCRSGSGDAARLGQDLAGGAKRDDVELRDAALAGWVIDAQCDDPFIRHFHRAQDWSRLAGNRSTTPPRKAASPGSSTRSSSR